MRNCTYASNPLSGVSTLTDTQSPACNSTRRDDRASSLAALVNAMVTQFRASPGNYLAFFSSFDYMEMAQQALQQRFADIPVWVQARQMLEADRQAFLKQFDVAGAIDWEGRVGRCV